MARLYCWDRKLMGPDPREMAQSDCIVIWGTNAVATQVNVMTHAIKARKERGAKIIAIDIYQTATLDQADLALVVKPGSDGALACAVMHILFRDNLADRDYLARASDYPEEFERHLQSKHLNGLLRLQDFRSTKLKPLPSSSANISVPFSARLRLFTAAQRLGEYARGKLHRDGDRRVAT